MTTRSFKVKNGLIIGSSTEVTSIVDEDTMTSNSATALATQQSIKAYVDTQTAAAGLLTVIGDDSSAASVTIENDDLKIAGGANITTSGSGDTLTAALDAALTGSRPALPGAATSFSARARHLMKAAPSSAAYGRSSRAKDELVDEIGCSRSSSPVSPMAYRL